MVVARLFGIAGRNRYAACVSSVISSRHRSIRTLSAPGIRLIQYGWFARVAAIGCAPAGDVTNNNPT